MTNNNTTTTLTPPATVIFESDGALGGWEVRAVSEGGDVLMQQLPPGADAWRTTRRAPMAVIVAELAAAGDEGYYRKHAGMMCAMAENRMRAYTALNM